MNVVWQKKINKFEHYEELNLVDVIQTRRLRGEIGDHDNNEYMREYRNLHIKQELKIVRTKTVRAYARCTCHNEGLPWLQINTSKHV